MLKKTIGIILIIIGFLIIFIEFQNPERGGWIGVIIIFLSAFFIFIGGHLFKKASKDLRALRGARKKERKKRQGES